MSDPVVHDLDILRPPPELVRLGGKEIDISFIPSGVAIDIMGMQQELQRMANTESEEDAQKSFQTVANLCAAITAAQHEEMTADWLLKNTDMIQMRALMDHVTKAVFKSLETVEDPDAKKMPAAEETNP